MSTMIFKNKTAEDVVIEDLGNATIPASTNKDLVNDLHLSLADIAQSDDLVVLLGDGTDSYQMNNGDRDLDEAEGLRFVTGLFQMFPVVPYNHRPIMRADSRPVGYRNYFTMRGDEATSIGTGKVFSWDFSNDVDDMTDPPSGYDGKRVEFIFNEGVYLKEGTLYFFNAPKGSYVEMHIVCPQNGYYKHPDGAIPSSALGQPGEDMWTQATEDTIIATYCRHLLCQGDCPMGDEFNSEGCTESAIPSSYKWWIDVLTPTGEATFNGYVELEIYRPNTCNLPELS